MSNNADQLCVELATELLRLSECARSYAPLAKTDPEQYVDAVENHFLQLIPLVADIRAAITK